MNLLSKIALAGAGTLALAGAAVAAGHEVAGRDRAAPQVRVLNVAMPDGSVRQIAYKGDVAPAVVFLPVRAAAPRVAANDPFAMMDRMMADMARQRAVMMRQVAALAAQAPQGATPGGAIALTSGQRLPAGTTVSYRIVSSSNGSGTCSRSVRMISTGADQAPQVISQTSGDCAAGAARATAPVVKTSTPPRPATPPANGPRVRDSI